MMRTLLVRGMLAGLIAGLLAFGFAKLVGEQAVDRAIDFETYVEHHSHHEASDDAPVSRSVQSSAGLGAGAVVFGVAVGGIFAIVFAFAYGRLGPRTVRGTAAVLGLLAFVSISLVPVLKYPANPPSIGNPDTIGRRTALFLVMILLSVTAVVLAVIVRRRLLPRLGEWDSTLVVAGGYVGAMVLCYVLLPGVNEVPQQAIRGVVRSVGDAHLTFPPMVLWRFRIASLGVQAVVWSTIAIAFGALAQRTLEPLPNERASAEVVERA
jgi:Probable cobalt transporter subunit (CbtA)